MKPMTNLVRSETVRRGNVRSARPAGALISMWQRVPLRGDGYAMLNPALKSLAATLLLASLLGATDLPPKHLRDAQALVAEIQPADNDYEHKQCFIKWKGIDGATRYENRTDCSDFLDLLLQHSYGITDDQLKTWTGHRRPLAEHWHDAILKASGLKQIAKLQDAKAGDVLAVKYPPGLADTGHIMLVCEPAKEITPKAPLVAGTRQWDVTVIDSSKSGHGPTDTRKLPDGTFGKGAGRGVLRIYTTDNGEIAGYCWSDSSKSAFEPQSERNMVIGRLDIQKSN
jgi:hypothetical protein